MHRFTTNASLNRLWEFAHMPQLIYFDPGKFVEELDKQQIPEFKLKDLNTVVELQTQLKKHGNAIRDFYIEDEPGLFDFLLAGFSIDATKDSDLFSYLDRLTSLNEEVMLSGILYSALNIGRFMVPNAELQAKADLMARDTAQLMSWLNSSEFSKEMKWRLLQISQSPKAEIQRYRDLMQLLEPIFKQYFAAYSNLLEPDLKDLLEKLSTNGPKPMLALTDGILDDAIIPDGEIILFISYFQPFHIAIKVSSLTPIISWGRHIETFMAYQQKLKEDALNDHIRIFKNLGDKTRYQVVQLVAQGNLSTKVIADQLGVTPATISYHLNNLVNAKILKLESIDGKFQYAINQQQLENTILAIQKHFNLKTTL